MFNRSIRKCLKKINDLGLKNIHRYNNIRLELLMTIFDIANKIQTGYEELNGFKLNQDLIII